MTREEESQDDPRLGDGVTVGLIGCGLWGRNILRDLVALGCHVLVVEPDREHREEALEGGAAGAVESVGDLNSVAGVVVSTPATTHATVVEALLPREVPILVEKPLTTAVADAERLLELRDRVFVGHTWRYHRGILALAEIVRSGELGPVRAVTSTRENWTSPRVDTDTAWTMLPHDLSIAVALFGEIPEARFAVAEVEGGRVVSLEALLGEDPWMRISASNRAPAKRRVLRLHCRDGVALLEGGEASHLTIARSSPEDPGEPAIERRALPGNPALYEELRVFVDHLRGGPAPPTDVAEGVAVVRGVARLRELAGIPV